MTRKFLV